MFGGLDIGIFAYGTNSDSLKTAVELGTDLLNVREQTHLQLGEGFYQGFEALGILESKVFDCIVLDLLMAGMKGLDFIRQHNKRGTGVPVIVVTADLQDTTRDVCLDLGVVAVLHKPVSENDLKHAFEQALGEES